MKGYSLKEETEIVLEELKKKGIKRDAIEKELGYSENYIDQQLSKGSNKRFLNAIKALNERILQKTTNIGSETKTITLDKEPLEKAILNLTETANRHSITDELNARNMERMITLLEKKFEREIRYNFPEDVSEDLEERKKAGAKTGNR